SLVSSRFPDLQAEEGGGELRLHLQDRARLRIRNNAVEQALQVLRNRIDQFGVAEPTIQAQGDDEIVVQLPGVQDPQRAKDLIGRTALLEFRLVAEGPNIGTPEHPGPGIDVMPGAAEAGQRRRYLLEKRPVMGGDVITDASVRRDIEGYYVNFVLDA